MRTKQQVIAEFRCSEILQAARKVFSQHGFRDACVDDIAAAAGLAKATIYNYFPSKEDIYLGALSQGVQELAERTQREMDAATGIRAKMEAFIRTRLQFQEENREFFAVYHAEFGNLFRVASLNQDFRELYRQQFDRLRDLLRQAAENGEIGDISTEALAVAIYESTRGMMLRRSLNWTQRGIDEQVDTLMRILWDGAAARQPLGNGAAVKRQLGDGAAVKRQLGAEDTVRQPLGKGATQNGVSQGRRNVDR